MESTSPNSTSPSPNIPEIMRALAAELPLNDFGLPTGIYRSDLLPFHLYNPNTPVTNQDPSESHKPLLLEADSPKQAVNADPKQESLDALDTEVVEVPVGPPNPVEHVSVDAFALLAGQGDGLPDMIVPDRVKRGSGAPPALTLTPSEYRIAGFPAAEISKAFVPIQYDEGFPAFDDGQAFWGRLVFEPADAHMAFDRYMSMSFGPEAGTRSIGTLVSQIKPDANDVEILVLTQKFKEYYHLYYWGLRARSYDLFRVTQHRQQQEIRAIETHDDHYLKARQMRSKLEEYMDDEEDFWDLLTPKVAIDFHKHLTGLERISAGVPAGGPMIKDGEGAGRSFEVEFATVAQAHRGDAAGDGTLLNEEGEVLDQALQDPAAVEVLQRLIIRTSGG